MKILFLVIPVKTEIQYYQIFTSSLDSRFRGRDDFLQNHHFLPQKMWAKPALKGVQNWP